MADTRFIIRCPACGQQLVKIYDPHMKINIDVCANGCGGIYFDDKEYEIFIENPENIEDTLDFIMTDNPKIVDEKEFRTCPVCKAEMAKTYLNGIDTKIQVDKCMNCGGVFLDYGELSVLRNPK